MNLKTTIYVLLHFTSHQSISVTISSTTVGVDVGVTLSTTITSVIDESQHNWHHHDSDDYLREFSQLLHSIGRSLQTSDMAALREMLASLRDKQLKDKRKCQR